jgi:hypothetical protein
MELSFDKCKIVYTKYVGGQKKLYQGHYITDEMELESARRKLALCLCDKYIQSHDSNLKAKIIEIYHTKENYFGKALGKDLPFDSIVAHKDEVFDPTVLID